MKTEILVALRMTVVTLVLTGLAYHYHRLARWPSIERRQPPHPGGGWSAPSSSPRVQERVLQPPPRPARRVRRHLSSGSNLGPTSQKLRDRVAADVARLRSENPGAPGPVPVELVTASGSGLDPHLSPGLRAGKRRKLAAARSVSVPRSREVITGRVEDRTWGILEASPG
jgi:K+-transporting ATPase ATPase C chain